MFGVREPTRPNPQPRTPNTVLAVFLLIISLIAVGCEVRRTPAPESTRQLRVSDVRRIVDTPALSPAVWSPDGTRVAFSTSDALMVTDLSGQARRIGAAEVATVLSWSPRLDVLAVVDRGILWTMRPDGSERARVDLPGFATAAVWAPGSDRLAVVLRRLVEGVPRFELWLLSRDGGFRRQITRAPVGKAMRDLQWFPNSLYLLYGLSTPSEPVITEAWQVRISYPDRRTLPVRRAVQLRLSPSGRAVAYVTGTQIEDGKGQVVIMKLDGSGAFVATQRIGRYSGLTWSPQGDKLAFAEAMDEAHAEISIVDADATGRLEVYRYAMEFSDPSIALSMSWAPDGRRFVFGTNTGTFTGPVWLATLVRR